MIRLVEVKKNTNFNLHENKDAPRYQLDEIWINPASIVQVKAEDAMKYNLSRGYLPTDLDSRQEFSRIHFGMGNNIGSVVVVGAPNTITEKIHGRNAKKVLKG